MPLVRAYSRNFGQRSILARKGTFFLKKGHQKFLVLHRNKALYNFRKRGQRSISELGIGLEYALLVGSNSHISTTLSHSLWKNVNGSKSCVLAVPMIISFKVLKYFFSWKIFFFICLPMKTRSQAGKNVVFFQKSWRAQR